MLLKRLALLAPLLAASSSPATMACNHEIELCSQAGRSCAIGCCGSLECSDRGTCQGQAVADTCAGTGRGSRSHLGPYQVYWGDLHGHTALSDGKGSLDHYFTYARDTSHLDFVVVSDHDYGNGPPWRLAREAWILTNDKADEYTADGRFVAIAGYEWTSNPIFWTSTPPLFGGPPKYYNHKTVYFPARVDDFFSAMDSVSSSPDLLAEAVRRAGGLIQNNHPNPSQSPDEFDYLPANASVIVNTEMWPDTTMWDGKRYIPNTERTLREFLRSGGVTGFVASTDTHDGQPAVRTAVLATDLTRDAIFEALRHRRNFAVRNAPIVLDVRIGSHFMGEEIALKGDPRIVVEVHGTAAIREVILVRDGAVLHSLYPGTPHVRFEYVDQTGGARSWYYVRVTQEDQDRHGNRSRAWSSPIWVTKVE